MVPEFADGLCRRAGVSPDSPEGRWRCEFKHCLALLWHFWFYGFGDEPFTVWASHRRRPCKEIKNGLSDGRHGWFVDFHPEVALTHFC